MSVLLSFIFFVIGIGSLSYFFRETLSRWVKIHSPLPVAINFFLIATPLIMIEEMFTCELDPFLPLCIAKTYPIFIILLLVPYCLQKFTPVSWQINVVFFGLLGWFAEFILAGRIYQPIPLPILMLLTAWVISIYAVISLLPLHYLHTTKSK